MRSHSAHVLLGEYASCVRCINSITLLCAQVCETCLSGLNCTSVKEEASSLRYPTLQSEHASGRYKTTYTPQTYTPQTYTPQTPNLHAPNQHAPNLHAPNQHAPNLHAPNISKLCRISSVRDHICKPWGRSGLVLFGPFARMLH